MANELEQRARELLAAEYVRSGASERTARVSSESPNNDSAIRAIVAALQQAQQPGAQAVAVETVGFVRTDNFGDKFIDWTHEGAIDALNIGAELIASAEKLTDENGFGEVYTAPPPPSLPDVSAVAWLNEDVLPDGYPYEVMFPYSKVDGVRMFPVFAPFDPPEISDEDVHAALQAYDDSPEEGWVDEWEAMRAALKCDRARHAKGGA